MYSDSPKLVNILRTDICILFGILICLINAVQVKSIINILRSISMSTTPEYFRNR